MYWTLVAIVSTPALIAVMVLDWAIHNPSFARDNHPAEFYDREHLEY